MSVRPWVLSLSLCDSTPNCLESFFPWLGLGVVLREVSWALSAGPVVRAWVAVPSGFGGAARGKQAPPLLCLQLWFEPDVNAFRRQPLVKQ